MIDITLTDNIHYQIQSHILQSSTLAVVRWPTVSENWFGPMTFAKFFHTHNQIHTGSVFIKYMLNSPIYFPWDRVATRGKKCLSCFFTYHTCESSSVSIFLPILRVPSVNFQNLPPVKKIKYNKILTYILRSIFLEILIWNSRADEKRWEIRMVKVNVIFNEL